MKESGVQWLGIVPANWEISRLKSRISKRFGGAWGEEPTPDNMDNARLCIRIADFDFNTQTVKSSASTLRVYTYSQIYKTKLLDGDIIVEKSGGGEKTPVGRTIIYNSQQFNGAEVLFANFCECFRLKNVESKFFAYIMKSFYQSNDMHLYFNQTTGLQNLDIEAVINSKAVFPPLEIQKGIVSFLDKECAKIDSIYADVEQQIETLEQYKRSIITESVTKGLNPNVAFASCDAKWLPKIPSHWKAIKGKYCFETRNTKGNHKNLELLSPTQKYGVIPQSLYEQYSTQVTVKVNEKTNLQTFKTIYKGDYCISLRSFEGGFEFSNYDGVVSPAYTVFYPVIDTDRRYYKYLFKIQQFITEMNSYSLSLRDGKPISFDDFGNTLIPIPPIEEQSEIANYLDKKCAEIESVIADKKKQLEVLENYKKSLIYEYVTGKKEVVNE